MYTMARPRTLIAARNLPFLYSSSAQRPLRQDGEWHTRTGGDRGQPPRGGPRPTLKLQPSRQSWLGRGTRLRRPRPGAAPFADRTVWLRPFRGEDRPAYPAARQWRIKRAGARAATGAPSCKHRDQSFRHQDGNCVFHVRRITLHGRPGEYVTVGERLDGRSIPDRHAAILIGCANLPLLCLALEEHRQLLLFSNIYNYPDRFQTCHLNNKTNRRLPTFIFAFSFGLRQII